MGEQPYPGLRMHCLLDKLGFKSRTTMRQAFYDELRRFHQDERHKHRQSLNTSNPHLLNEEFLNFMRLYGNHYFGPRHRSHLTHTAKNFLEGADNLYIVVEFKPVRSALLNLSKNYKRRMTRQRQSILRQRQRSSTASYSKSSLPVEDSPYTPSEGYSSETSQTIEPLHSSEPTDSERIPSPNLAQTSEPRSTPSQSHDQGTPRNAAAHASTQTPTTEPWDRSSCAVDWTSAQMGIDSPTSGQQLQTPCSTRSSTMNNRSTLSKPATRRRSRHQYDEPAATTPVRYSPPCPTARAVSTRDYRDAQLQPPDLEVHFCVRNARNAFEKWPHGGLRSHTVDTFFKKLHECCRLRGRLTSVTFTLTDAIPRRTWTVEEGDAFMFESLKSKTRRIIAEGEYAGVFEILMEPTVEMDEEDIDDSIILDI